MIQIRKPMKDANYQARVYQDLKKNNELLAAHGLRSPRVWFALWSL
jgi:hypothetical protein